MKYIYSFCSLCLAIIMASCTSQTIPSYTSVDYIPAKREKSENWGLVDEKGQMLFADEFENCPSFAVEGVFSVKENDSYTLYYAEKKPTIVPGCEGLTAAGSCRDGLIPIVHKDQRISVIDKEGNVKFTMNPIDGVEIASCDTWFSYGMIRVTMKDNRVAILDKNGKIVIKPLDGAITIIGEDRILISKTGRKPGEHSTLGIVDKKGKPITREYNADDYNGMWGTNIPGYIVMTNKEGNELICDLDGKVLVKCPKKVKWVEDISDNCYIYQDDVEDTDYDGQHGIISFTGETVVRAKYKHISFTEDGMALANKKNGKGVDVINKKGEVEYSLEGVAVHVKGVCSIYSDDSEEFYIINSKGEKSNKEPVIFGKNDDGLEMTTLSSDYVDYDSALSIIKELIVEKSLAKELIQIGAKAYKIPRISCKKTDDFGPSSSYISWNSEKNGYSVCVGIKLSSKLVITKYKSQIVSTSGYSYTQQIPDGKMFNPEATVVGLCVSISQIRDDKQDEFVKRTVDLLKKAGLNDKYRVETDGISLSLSLSQGEAIDDWVDYD